MPKLVKNNGEPILSNNSLLKNNSTRLRFSVWVIIANFILGIIGMILGADLTALGVFISLCNTPLYAYIMGRTFRGADITESYYQQPHSGSGGISNIINKKTETTTSSSSYDTTSVNVDENPPMEEDTKPKKKVKTVEKENEDIG